MQAKNLVIIALIGIVMLLAFNVINGNLHKNNRQAIASSNASAQSTTSDSDSFSNHPSDGAAKPLGEQPKAIIDKATTQINNAQQADSARFEQVDSTQ